MVFKTNETVDFGTDNIADRKENTSTGTQSTGNSSIVQKTKDANLPCVGEFLENTGVSEKSKALILNSWRKGTTKQYKTYLNKWKKHCTSTGHNPISPPLHVGIDFLAELADTLGYNAVNTARSALSSKICLPNGTNFGKHPLVKRLLKGVFEKKPSLP